MYADTLLAELEQEAQTTRRVLERLPNEHLDWRPAPLGMRLGQLAWHVATIPGNISQLAQRDALEAAGVDFEPRMPASADEVIPAYEAALETARDYRGQLSVYYRCLGVPVPAIYGRSADEKLFGA
jgi:uncharacterized damage-inducible protein DinB